MSRLRAALLGVLVLVLGALFVVARLCGLGGTHPGPVPTPGPSHGPSPGPSPTTAPTSPAAGPSVAPPSPTPAGALFRIGTLNWRGASHYLKDPHRGERPYDVRVPNMIDKIDDSRVSIVGFQEFEPRQERAFLRATKGHWGLVTGTSETGRRDTRDAVAYRTDVWRVDKVRTLSIVYAGRHRVRIPLARFTGLAGTPAHGHAVWVLNTHNPASVRFIGGTAVSRAYDVALEAAALRRLASRKPHTGVLFTGDMNSKTAFRDLFLGLAGPGWTTADPADEPDLIDWIMGGPGVGFAGTTVDWSTKDHARRYTDHPFVHTAVTALP